MKNVAKIIIRVLASFGVVVLILWLFTWFQMRSYCERDVLTRAVSPNGMLAAEHYRTRCQDEQPDEYFFEVGSSRMGSGATATRIMLRSFPLRSDDWSLSMKPLRIWWLSEKKLHIEFSPRNPFKVSPEFGGVEIESQIIE